MKAYAIANGVGFQLTWWAIVLSAAKGHPALSVACAAVVISLHLIAVQRRRSEFALLLLCGASGVVIDTTLMQFGLFRAVGSGAALCPLWLVGLWMAFGATLNHALGWLRPYPLIAALLSAVGGAAAYWGGIAVGALETRQGTAVLLGAFALVWAPLVPLLQLAGDWLTRRLEPATADS